MQVQETSAVYLQALQGKPAAMLAAFSAMSGSAGVRQEEKLMRQYLHEPPAVRMRV